MTVASSLPGALSSLTELEREILHLLASGHTVKTIAAALGRSEAAINERLRDARRKTGASSSRELARQLGAQKNWDRKIDLSTGSGDLENSTSLSVRKRKMSKGMKMALISLPLALVAILAANGASEHAQPGPGIVASATANAPLLGTWALDVNRLPANERPKSVTMRFESPVPGAWNGTVETVAPDGSVQHAESAATLDGPAVPLSGNMPFADSVAVRQPAPDTLVMTFEKDGRQVMTRIYTLENDGQAMKETMVWAGDERPRTVNTFWNRVR